MIRLIAWYWHASRTFLRELMSHNPSKRKLGLVHGSPSIQRLTVVCI